MRRYRALLVFPILAIAVAALAPAFASQVMSKEYKFQLGTLLEMEATNPDGLRIDGVQFDPPGGGLLGSGIGADMHAQVAVSNNGPVPRKVRVSVALFDEQKRLVGVASGGAMMPVKPGKRKFLTLAFDGVSVEAHRATRFYISLETQ